MACINYARSITTLGHASLVVRLRPSGSVCRALSLSSTVGASEGSSSSGYGFNSAPSSPRPSRRSAFRKKPSPTSALNAIEKPSSVFKNYPPSPAGFQPTFDLDFSALTPSTLKAALSRTTALLTPSHIATLSDSSRWTLQSLSTILLRASRLDASSLPSYLRSLSSTHRPLDQLTHLRLSKARRDVESGSFAEEDALPWEEWKKRLESGTLPGVDWKRDVERKMGGFKRTEKEVGRLRGMFERGARARREVMEEMRKEAERVKEDRKKDGDSE